MDIAWGIAVVLSGLAAGAAANTALAMVPALRSLDEQTAAEVRRVASTLPGLFVAVTSAVAGLAGLALLAFADLSSSSEGLVVAALIVTGAAIGASAALRRGVLRWDLAQFATTVASIAALSCYAAMGPAA